MAPGSFQDEQGNPTEEDGDDVGNEEGATAVLVAQVGKAPHIAQPNGLKFYYFLNFFPLTYPTQDMMKSAQEDLKNKKYK